MDGLRRLMLGAAAHGQYAYQRLDGDGQLLAAYARLSRRVSWRNVMLLVAAFASLSVLLLLIQGGLSDGPALAQDEPVTTTTSSSTYSTPAAKTQSVSWSEVDWRVIPTDTPKLEEGLPSHRRLVIVVPATDPSPNLCKLIVSALALGYPTPVIINWKRNHRDFTKWTGGENLPKIPGMVEYLDAAMHPDAHPSEKLREKDLVLFVDAYDVWFQLPPELLLRRYYEINREANERLRKQWPEGGGKMPMRQTIVAASGKNCYPHPDSGSNLHCDILPLSPLPGNLYGPGTEKNHTQYRDHRPRFINGGVYLGPAGDMRRLFRRAVTKLEEAIGDGRHMYSEQGVTGSVLGEQELWRRWRRKNAPVDDANAGELMNRELEYHLGLDYGQQLSIQTMWTTKKDEVHNRTLLDGDWVQLDNQTQIDEASAALGIKPSRLRGVPEDIRKAENPLEGARLEGGETLTWGNMSLHADFFTQAVPVIVHHNGDKEVRETWWDRPWFFPHLKLLLGRALLAESDMPSNARALGRVPSEKKDTKQLVSYWPLSAQRDDKRPRLMPVKGSAKQRLQSIDFKDVCRFNDPDRDWLAEVFRDGKPWAKKLFMGENAGKATEKKMPDLAKMMEAR